MAGSTAYVILAAGKGSRMGRVGADLHKVLLPLQQKAILTHLIELAPPDADIIICAGYRQQQLLDYVALAHVADADRITFITVDGWDRPGAGPGASLLAAQEAVGDRNMVLTSCDTLWDPDPELWQTLYSWSACAPVPPGTPPERWCIMVQGTGHGPGVNMILDKEPGVALSGNMWAYTGLSRIIRADLQRFWDGLSKGELRDGEVQVSGGLKRLVQSGRLMIKRVAWLDTGDAAAYRKAVITRDGFDWSKGNEVTWVLPGIGRVIKWWADPQVTVMTEQRRLWLAGAEGSALGIPRVVDHRQQMLALEYVTGECGYDVVKTTSGWLDSVKESAAVRRVVISVDVPDSVSGFACELFYRTKTQARVKMLSPAVRPLAEDVLRRVNWQRVTMGCQPVRWHGDFNLGNMIFDGEQWHLIDWRHEFASQLWGDWRHDVAKFTAGLRVRWDWARRGDFTPWEDGLYLARRAVAELGGGPGTEEIGILTLLASAPLHESPLDEMLVVRAAAWMSELR